MAFLLEFGKNHAFPKEIYLPSTGEDQDSINIFVAKMKNKFPSLVHQEDGNIVFYMKELQGEIRKRNITSKKRIGTRKEDNTRVTSKRRMRNK